MSSNYGSEMESSNNTDNTPTACFQNLCQVMLNDSSNDLTKKNIEDFRVILHIIMHECSKANIESGKVWIAEHCRTPAHATALMEYILSLSRSRKGQQERLHMIYLVSDILFHASRRQHLWLKESILSLLSPLLMLAYESTESTEYRAKVDKVISLWGEYNIFEPSIIDYLKQSLYRQSSYSNRNFQSSQQHYPSQPYQYPPQSYQQPPYMQQQTFPQQQQRHQFNSIYPPPQQQPQAYPQKVAQAPPTPPQKQYFELPVGLMLIAKSEDYTPIDPAKIKVFHPRPPASKEILEAVDEFYKDLDLSNMENEISVLEDKSNKSQYIDAQGWEKGYLDFHYQSIANRKESKENEHRRQESSTSSSRNNRYEEERRGRSYDKHSSSRRRSYSRSQSPPKSRRYQSPPRSRRNYSPPRGTTRNWSPRRRSPPPRDRSPVRRNSPPRYNKRRYSRSRSPPSIRNNSRGDFGMGAPPPENKYLGLGNAAVADEYDSFRRNKSQAYNRREPHQPLTCYKCNKVGHLARECQSL